MRRSLLAWAVTLSLPLALLLVSPPAARPQPADDKAVAGDDALVRKIKAAIDEGVAFLKSQQRRTDGSWEGFHSTSEPGGWTALAVVALLNSGLTAKDPAVEKGLKYLRTVSPSRTYVVSLQTMAFCLARQNEDRERIQRNVKWLLDSRLPDGWTYAPRQLRQAGVADNSCTQYALLALHEALVAGFKVDEKALAQIRQIYINSQTRDGGWGYRNVRVDPRMTMTTAGLCNLIISGLDVSKTKAVLQPDGSAKDCGRYDDNEAIAKGLKYIGARYPSPMTDETAMDRFNANVFYCLYGIERAGRLTGQRFFGGHDWYEVGARYLVGAQRADGSWAGIGGRGSLDHWPLVSTSFALLFLSKGKAPVLISKLAYGGADYMGWNNKRSDVKNLVEFASRELFKGLPLAWQAFDIRGIDANDGASRRKLAAELLQAPVVFLNGHDFAPRGKEEEVLKEFVENGGVIVAENCCGKDKHPKFDEDLRKMLLRIFPDSKLEPLEPEHPVWTASGKYALTAKDFPLEGIKLGCKTVVIYSPTPLAGWWEHNKFADKGRGQKAFEMGANIIAYATGLEAPRPRLSRVEILGDGKHDKPKRGYLQVGQLRHTGDWQPAPKAMRNLMAEARKVGLDVMLNTKAVFPSEEAVLDYRFLYMHGRGKFDSDRKDLKHLRFALKSGGLLLADACCGAKAFDASFRKLVEELFSEDKLKLVPVPADDPLYGAELNGQAIKTVRRRDEGGKKEMETKLPKLEGVKYKGRWVVLYSKYDIGCALEKHSAPDCVGHDPASALKLARAAVLYALKR